MKYLRSALFTLGLLLAVSATQAQRVRVKADIPFDFAVGNQVLPAGEYQVIPTGGSLQTLLIRASESTDTAAVITFACSDAKRTDTTKLVFHVVGGRYFLSQIWTEGYEQGRQLPKSKMETQLAKNSTTEELFLAANVTR
jgi:hypothetical protein